MEGQPCQAIRSAVPVLFSYMSSHVYLWKINRNSRSHQVITLQKYWRQWLARKFVEGLRRDKLRKMEWDKEEVRPADRPPLGFLLIKNISWTPVGVFWP